MQQRDEVTNPDRLQGLAARPTADTAADALRGDVRRLGELVGDVLREQQGGRIFAAVEHVRTSAIAARGARRLGALPAAHDLGAHDSLLDWVAQQPSEDLLTLIRAFGIYFHVINLAEQHHRMRMLRVYEHSDQPVHESIAAALATLAARGVPAEGVRALLAHLSLHPVLTAHPSEARRRSLLHHLEQVVALLDELDDPRATPHDRQRTLDALRLRITEIYQSAETRIERPSVEEEARTTQYYVATTLYDVAPRLRQALQGAFHAAYPHTAPLDVDTSLRIGSWVGGDRDGNPAVSGEVTRDVAQLARDAILRRYRDEVHQLGRDLSLSLRLVGASPELLASIQHDRTDLDVQPVRQWRDEPYRQKLGLIGERLRRSELGGRGGYSTADEFAADLALLAASLRAHQGGRIADGPVRALQDRLHTFGFFLAELDIRQHAERHAQAVAEVIYHAGRGAYLALDEPGRQVLLSTLLSGPPLTHNARALSSTTRDTLDAFAAMADMQRAFGPDVGHTYIISMCRTPSDVLAALFLARECGLFTWYRDGSARCDLDIVPLFETLDELAACDTILSQLMALPAYRAAIAARQNRQQIMIGYSDSTKEGGYLAASWATYRAAALLSRAAQQLGLTLTLFHGRGGAIGRGGGPMGRAILARAPEARTPQLKVTEQGEMIFARYGLPDIAERHLEQMMAALLLSAADEDRTGPETAWIEAIQHMVIAARRRYDALLKDSPAAMEFFRQATPFAELSTLQLASRPVSRSGGSVADRITLDDIRAIPWVFSWTQIRANLPGWYGLGAALRAEIAAGRVSLLQEMYRGWRFFAQVLDNAQISLGTADMETTRRYATLAADGHDILRALEEEYQHSVDAVLAITGQQELLDNVPTLQRTIKLRNPYVDALHLAQITLLRRYRVLPPDAPESERAFLLDAIHHSINGIAAGLQTTG
jgi:phosphoenolpyruvate carboxylase